MLDKYDPMNMFHSKKPFKERKREEESEQLRFCKWLKHEHPTIRFRSDMQAGEKKSYGRVSLASILDPWKGWPDVAIYLKRGNCCGLQIELKKIGSGVFLKDGSLSTGKHVQEQAEMHEFLRSLGWKVEFAEGAEEAKRIFLEYVGNINKS